jgi:hypothetical protein
MKAFSAASHGLFSAVLALLLIIPPVCQCAHGLAERIRLEKAVPCHCHEANPQNSDPSRRPGTQDEHSAECRSCTQRVLVIEKNSTELGSINVISWIPVLFAAVSGFEINHISNTSTAWLSTEKNAYKPLPREILYQNCTLLI